MAQSLALEWRVEALLVTRLHSRTNNSEDPLRTQVVLAGHVGHQPRTSDEGAYRQTVAEKEKSEAFHAYDWTARKDHS